MILNITNGEYFNNYIKQKNDGIFLPFNEAMITGDTSADIFSEEFLKIRSLHHHVSISEYKNKLNRLIDQNFIKSFDEINLWFGKDAYCQINLLTLLAYFEQINFNGITNLIFIDDESFEILCDKTLIDFSNFKKIYCDVLLEKKSINSNNIIINKAIKDYLDLSFRQDIVSNFIRNNQDKDYSYLLAESLKISKDLGLSDTIINNLISSVLNAKNFHLFYHEIYIGKFSFDEKSLLLTYIPDNKSISHLPQDNLLHFFLKDRFYGNIDDFPFFEQRYRSMKNFNLTEVKYPNDFYLLKLV